VDEEFEEDKEDDEGDVNLSEADTIRKKYRDEKKVQVKAISPPRVKSAKFIGIISKVGTPVQYPEPYFIAHANITFCFR
jgi:hypothetical protein